MEGIHPVSPPHSPPASSTSSPLNTASRHSKTTARSSAGRADIRRISPPHSPPASSTSSPLAVPMRHLKTTAPSSLGGTIATAAIHPLSPPHSPRELSTSLVEMMHSQRSKTTAPSSLGVAITAAVIHPLSPPHSPRELLVLPTLSSTMFTTARLASSPLSPPPTAPKLFSPTTNRSPQRRQLHRPSRLQPMAQPTPLPLLRSTGTPLRSPSTTPSKMIRKSLSLIQIPPQEMTPTPFKTKLAKTPHR